ncbi:MAG: type II toxin-antitoxin system VapC family toxin [Desulfobacterales bacterium]|nr:type II toxin-antitoxin system VapC family toxin [Desulfobacterales bacterium]
MKPKVYIETTIPSYLAAWPSRDLVKAAQQQITHEWWQIRKQFDLYISQIVIHEASGGDEEAAVRRLSVLEGIFVLDVTLESRTLAQELIVQHSLPEKAVVDALHIAISVINGMDYLLTWNCTHIANAAMRHKIEGVCRIMGYDPPVICTPNELMEV